LAQFFSGLARFFSGLGSVQFFRFQAYKTETEPAGFFKILIGFFSRFGFFGYFFLFSRFNWFFDFVLLTLTPFTILAAFRIQIAKIIFFILAICFFFNRPRLFAEK